MAGSYLGSIIMPPAFGFIAGHFSAIVWPIALAFFVGSLLVCVCLLDWVTRKKLNNAFATERIMDVLQQVKTMEEQRKRARRERRRLRRKQKREKLLKSRGR
jgi:MFS family permease